MNLQSERDKQIYERVKKEIEEKENKRSKNKKLPVSLIIIFTLIIGSFVYVNKDIILDDFFASGTEENNEEFKIEENEVVIRSEEHTSELQSRGHLVCRLLLEKKKKTTLQ